MDMLSGLGAHPASLLVAVALGALCIRLFLYLFRGKPASINQAIKSNTWATYFSCFFSGVLFTNAVPHFVHGISGEQFPAPFGFWLGTGLLEHLSNVGWGFINIVLGYGLFVTSKLSDHSLVKKIIFFSGILAMGIFLSVVFSH